MNLPRRRLFVLYQLSGVQIQCKKVRSSIEKLFLFCGKFRKPRADKTKLKSLQNSTLTQRIRHRVSVIQKKTDSVEHFNLLKNLILI